MTEAEEVKGSEYLQGEGVRGQHDEHKKMMHRAIETADNTHCFQTRVMP